VAIRREKSLSQIRGEKALSRGDEAMYIADACHYGTQQTQHMVKTLVVPHSVQAYRNDVGCPTSTPPKAAFLEALVALHSTGALADAFEALHAWMALTAPTTTCMCIDWAPK
jgi:hypothetical protein